MSDKIKRFGDPAKYQPPSKIVSVRYPIHRIALAKEGARKRGTTIIAEIKAVLDGLADGANV